MVRTLNMRYYLNRFLGGQHSTLICRDKVGQQVSRALSPCITGILYLLLATLISSSRQPLAVGSLFFASVSLTVLFFAHVCFIVSVYLD